MVAKYAPGSLRLSGHWIWAGKIPNILLWHDNWYRLVETSTAVSWRRFYIFPNTFLQDIREIYRLLPLTNPTKTITLLPCAFIHSTNIWWFFTAHPKQHCFRDFVVDVKQIIFHRTIVRFWTILLESLARIDKLKVLHMYYDIVQRNRLNCEKVVGFPLQHFSQNFPHSSITQFNLLRAFLSVCFWVMNEVSTNSLDIFRWCWNMFPAIMRTQSRH